LNTQLESVTQSYAFIIHFYQSLKMKGSLQMCITIAVVDWSLGNWRYHFLAHSKQGCYHPVSTACGDWSSGAFSVIYGT